MDKPNTSIAAPAPVARSGQPRAAGDVLIKGTADCTWGVLPTVSYGTITDEDVDSKIEAEPHENQKGQRTGTVIYDGSDTLTLSIIAKASETEPVKGTVLTYNSKSYLILSAKRTAAAKGKVKYQVTAEAWDNQTLSAGT